MTGGIPRELESSREGGQAELETDRRSGSERAGEDDGGSDNARSRRSVLAFLASGTAGLTGCFGVGSGGESQRPTPLETELTGTPTSTSGTHSNSRTGRQSPTPTPTLTPVPSRDHYVYVGHDELKAVAERVRDGRKPWVNAYTRAIRDADEALEMEARSVVDDGAPNWDDPHRFGKDENRHDYHAAIDMTTAVRDTALAYWFTGQDEYAERAIDLLYHWCHDPETRMKPDGNMADNNTGIELFVTIPKLWYGAAFLDGHPYWTEKTGDDLEATFADWVGSFVSSIPAPKYYQYNNIWAWRIATLASAASYLDDQSRLEKAFCMWRGKCETVAHDKERPRPWSQYRPSLSGKGYLKRELAREDGFGYHVYGMKALTMTAEVARQHDVDLYGYNAPTDPGDGSTLRKLFEFMSPYMKLPSRWQWGKGSDSVTNFEMKTYASVFEIAHSLWESPEYLDVVRSAGRPTYDIRHLGWTSLTHANRFDLSDG